MVFVEQGIIAAVRGLLAGRVNEILEGWNFFIPIFEFSNYKGNSAITPVISLSLCEQAEKERIIRLNAYSMGISISIPESPESEMYCYAYSNAFEKALGEDVTLGGIMDRAIVISKKYIPPKKPNCGEGWELVLSLRVTIEELKQ